MAEDPDAYVAVVVVHLRFPEAHSLKSRRRELMPIVNHLRGRLGFAVSEVGFRDGWQRATLLASLTSGSLARLDAELDALERWLELRCPDGVRVERLLRSLEDLRA